MFKKGNKYTTILLLATVIVVWGFFFYKLFGASKSREYQFQNFNNTGSLKFTFDQKQIKKVSLDYQDPFGLERKIAPEKVYKPVKKKKKAVEKKKKVYFPRINYSGYIGASSQISFFVVNIKNQQHLVKVGDVIDGVELIQGNHQKVTLQFKEEIKEYDLNK